MSHVFLWDTGMISKAKKKLLNQGGYKVKPSPKGGQLQKPDTLSMECYHPHWNWNVTMVQRLKECSGKDTAPLLKFTSATVVTGMVWYGMLG